MDIKPGFKTTEFWTLLAQMVTSTLALCGILTQQHLGDGWANLVASLVYFVTNAWLAHGYNNGRVALKQQKQ